MVDFLCIFLDCFLLSFVLDVFIASLWLALLFRLAFKLYDSRSHILFLFPDLKKPSLNLSLHTWSFLSFLDALHYMGCIYMDVGNQSDWSPCARWEVLQVLQTFFQANVIKVMWLKHLWQLDISIRVFYISYYFWNSIIWYYNLEVLKECFQLYTPDLSKQQMMRSEAFSLLGRECGAFHYFHFSPFLLQFANANFYCFILTNEIIAILSASILDACTSPQPG